MHTRAKNDLKTTKKIFIDILIKNLNNTHNRQKKSAAHSLDAATLSHNVYYEKRNKMTEIILNIILAETVIAIAIAIAIGIKENLND